MLCSQAEAVERLWEVASPLLATAPPVMPYSQGFWGPAAAASDIVLELDEVNDYFEWAEVVLVIGAYDTVNPAANDEPDPPAGMSRRRAPSCDIPLTHE